jgi:chorismate mutase
VAVRAVRGATQLDRDDRDEMLVAVVELMSEILRANDLSTADLVSAFFTATPDLVCEFPAFAARQLNIGDVPLMCAQEIAVEGALPRVVRVMVHAETDRARADMRHVYLRGATVLRKDLAQ